MEIAVTCSVCGRNFKIDSNEMAQNVVNKKNSCPYCNNKTGKKDDTMILLGCVCKICGNKFDIDTKDKTTPRDCPYCNGRKEMPIKEPQQYVPKCPTCQSPDIVRLTTTQKVVSVGLFGVFGGRSRKTFHCNSCKYEW